MTTSSRRPLLLEVIVCSVADAEEAVRGGADRLEIVRDLDREGLTPPLSLVSEIVERVRVPVRVMLRENAGFGVETPDEIDRLMESAAAFAQAGVNGFVIGFARGGRVDVETTSRVLSAAAGVPATFHRAFDEASDAGEALAALRTCPGVDRVLTVGGRGSWDTRIERWRALARQADGHFTILAGGGIDAEGVRRVARVPELTEVHVGRAAREPETTAGAVSAAKVALLAALCRR